MPKVQKTELDVVDIDRKISNLFYIFETAVEKYLHRPSLGVPGVRWQTQILADQFTLFQPGGTDYAHLITTGTPRFSDLPTALSIFHHH